MPQRSEVSEIMPELHSEIEHIITVLSSGEANRPWSQYHGESVLTARLTKSMGLPRPIARIVARYAWDDFVERKKPQVSVAGVNWFQDDCILKLGDANRIECRFATQPEYELWHSIQKANYHNQRRAERALDQMTERLRAAWRFGESLAEVSKRVFCTEGDGR